MTMNAIINADRLVKRYDSFTAVDNISFTVFAGECFGFLGPNGAGKTSTIRMIACISPVTSGELWVAGMDVHSAGRQIRALLGVVPQEDNLDPDLTVKQNLTVYARYFDIPRKVARSRVDEALAFMQLLEKRGSPIDALSGGMKRRLVIARALLNQPKILILDEPTTGLDPQARHMVWQKLRQLKAQGVTMLLCTHYMEEAAHLCDRLVIMHQGRILAAGTPTELIDHYVGKEVVELHVERDSGDVILARLQSKPGVTIEQAEDIVYLYLREQERPEGLAELHANGHRIVYRPANLEDVFLRLTGRGLTE